MNLTFRNTTTYHPDGSFIPDGYIFTVSTSGRQNWTNSLNLDKLVVSTFTLNSTFIVASTNTNNMVIFSTLVVSSTDSRNVTYSTLRGDTIITNNLSLNSNLTVGSTFSNLVQTSTLASLSMNSLTGSVSTLSAAEVSASSVRTGAMTAQTATVASTLTTSTLVADNTTGRIASVDTLYGRTLAVSTLLTTSSLAVSGSATYSTLSGSSFATNYATVRSTLVASTVQGSTVATSSLVATQAEIQQLSVPSLATLSLASISSLSLSSLTGGSVSALAIQFSTLLGSTLTLNTVFINSSLVTSSFATGSLNFSTLMGSTIGANVVTVNSTLYVSTTETQGIVVNRQSGTALHPTYKIQVDQGSGMNENGLYISNSNYGSDQGLAISMMNDGFSYFGSYAKLQGKRSGSAGLTNIILQSDGGKVGVGTTNPDALLDVHTHTATPATMFVYNAQSGTNTTGGDVTVAAINMGSAGSGLYYDSIRVRVPNAGTMSAARLDLCTPAGATDNTQTTRLSVMPYTGYVGVGTTTPTNLLTAYGAGYGLVHTDGTIAVASYLSAVMGLLGTKSAHSLGFFTNSGAAQMTVTPSGNVGIGTTTPGNLLTVYGSGYGLVHADGTIAVASYTNATMGLLGTKSNHALGFFTNSATTAQVTLLPSGYVGVGTTAPTNLVHAYSNSTNLAAIRLTSASLGWGSGMLFENTTATTGRTYGLYSDSTPGTFHIADVTANADRMVIDKTGQVGIGLTNPVAALDVNGGIISRQQWPAVSLLGDVDGAKWLMKLGGYNLSFMSDNTGFTGMETVTAFSRTFRTAVQLLGTTGGMSVKGSIGVGGETAPAYRVTALGSQPMNGTSTSVAPEIIYGGIRNGTGSVQNTTSFGLGLCGTTTAIDPYGRLDMMVNGYPAAGNIWGSVPDVKVMSIIGNGTVGIGTTAPIDTLDVNGSLRVVSRGLFPGYNNSGSTYYPGLINLGGGYGPQIRSVYPNAVYTDYISLQFCTNQGSNDGTLVPRMHISAQSGNVGVGTVSPTSKFHVKDGRMDLSVYRAPFTGLHDWTSSNRAQFVLSSEYSDLVIASSQVNNNHGSTLTFASYNPADGSQYRKWVINQGNWGTRLHMLEFGYSDYSVLNPHSNIDGSCTLLTLDGINKRVGIGSTNPSHTLHVEGSTYINGTLTCGTLNATNVNVIPYGCIILWYGESSSRPSGWAICDGTNGTPDLRDRFVVGAGYSYAKGNTGGANTVALTVDQMPSHTHKLNLIEQSADNVYKGNRHQMWGHGSDLDYYAYGNRWSKEGADDNAANKIDYVGICNKGGNAAHENRPPYYALYYIMKL